MSGIIQRTEQKGRTSLGIRISNKAKIGMSLSLWVKSSWLGTYNEVHRLNPLRYYLVYMTISKGGYDQLYQCDVVFVTRKVQLRNETLKLCIPWYTCEHLKSLGTESIRSLPMFPVASWICGLNMSSYLGTGHCYYSCRESRIGEMWYCITVQSYYE